MALQNIEANITLDLYNHDTTPTTIKAIQLDSETRYVAARLQNMGAQYDMDSGATVQLTVIRPDKVGVQISGTTFTYGDEGAQFLGPYAELTLVALAVSGKLLGQFKITSGTQILRTEIFTISAGVALDASTDEWAGEYDGYNLDELVEKVDAAVDKVDGMEADVSELKSEFSEMLNATYVTDTATGAIAHFEDGADNIPMKSLKVAIEPVQEGSGDPSPENVRPITGWDAVKVTRCGKNLAKEASVYNLNNYIISPVFLHKGTYTVSVQRQVSDKTSIYVRRGKTVDLSRTAFFTKFNVISASFTVEEADYYFVQIYRETGTETWDDYPITNATIEVGDAVTEFEPYNGNTYDVSLASAGTVYGGTLDVVSGELVVDRKYELFDGSSDEAWKFLTGSFGNRCGIVRNDVLNTGSRVKVDANEGMYSASANTVGTVFAGGVSIYYYPPTTVTTLEEYKTWLASNNLQIVYPLATPTVYRLTPTEVKSILGINNVWSNAGDTTVEYRADTKLYIDRRIAEVTA